MLFIFVTAFLISVYSVHCSNIFHERTKINFHPNVDAKYFGYTVLLTDDGLIVGAPKASNPSMVMPKAPGNIFNCDLNNLNNVNNITCSTLQVNEGIERFRFRRTSDFFKDDMWLGASISVVPKGRLLICAPRWTTMYQTRFNLANGACFLRGPNRGMALYPLQERKLQAWVSDGHRKEYGEYGAHLNFFAYGQAGMSMKVTENMSVIIGAPGLLQWTGGIVDYKIYITDYNTTVFSEEKITNLYQTNDLGPDDYFGYSVDSGIFQLNGTTLYVAGAPRSKSGHGQVKAASLLNFIASRIYERAIFPRTEYFVLIFDPPLREADPLRIRAKVHGPHLGSYFGASLCCTDIDGDGRTDLLVGAPTFVRRNGGLPYDQGAVYVYMSRENGSSFILQEAEYITGSDSSGARFGSAIADLGDINDDGYKDIAVGAPWENDGFGAVYIYKGTKNGLNKQYIQRIFAENARSFGMSISKGYDVDNNNCNDLAVGAIDSATAYIYRCVPTMQVHASIQVPDAMDLPQNSTNFTAIFCATAPPKKSWPHVKIKLKAIITIDREGNRAGISGDNEYIITISPGKKVCDEQTVEVKPKVDLSTPISIKMDLKPMELMNENSTTFLMNAARLSEDSTLQSSFDIQLTRDCGEDLTCTPWLVVTLEAIDNPYIPGSNTTLGVRVTVFNKDEPAYDAKVNLVLPCQPKRVPSACTLEVLNMTCNLPQPLNRGETIEWDIEMEYEMNATNDIDIKVEASLEDHLFRKSVGDKPNDLIIRVHPIASFGVSGKSFPNDTIVVTRDIFNEGGLVKFSHYYQVTNYGPSDWSDLHGYISFTEENNVTLAEVIPGCEKDDRGYSCKWSIEAKRFKSIILQLRYNLSEYGQYLNDKGTINVTTSLNLTDKILYVNTTLILAPGSRVWPMIIAGVITGLLILAGIIYTLYKFGFFLRKSHEELMRLQEQSSLEGPSVSLDPLIDEDSQTQEVNSESS